MNETNGKVLYSKVCIKTILLTPEEASKYLERNNDNRPINRKNVNKYVKAIKEGTFVPTGDCILIDKYGNLLNGQHRLTAIVETGIPVYIDIKYGVEPDVKFIINEGRPTTTTDKGTMFLSKYDISPKMYAPIAKTIEFINNKGKLTKNKLDYSPYDIISFFENNEKSLNILRKISNHASQKKNPFGNASHALMKEVVFHIIDTEKAQEFFDSIYDCSFLKGTPTHTLWMWLNKRKENNKNARWGARGEEELDAAINVAWNAFIKGKTLEKIRIMKNGDLIKVDPIDVNGNLQKYFDKSLIPNNS